METTLTQPRSQRTGALPRGRWMLAAAGLIIFHLAWLLQGDERGFWLPGLGVGIVLFSWFGWQVLPILALDLLLVRWQTQFDAPWLLLCADTILYALQIGLSWWLYHHIAGGSRWLDDPRSATIFLILVPGGLSALAAFVQALWTPAGAPEIPLWILAASYWLSRMAGILVVVPLLIIGATPLLLRYRLLDLDLPPTFHAESEGAGSRRGDRIELAGLTFATTLLALILLWAHLQTNAPTVWMLWATCLILVVWTCIRQGLRGGSFCAGIASAVVLIAVQFLMPLSPGLQTGIQGNLLAFCSTGLLVGVSASWIRANETRYRQVVSRIPFVVYSVRLPYGIPAQVVGDPKAARADAKVDLHVGPSLCKLANVVLVSPACKQVFGSDAETLVGPFTRWLEQVVPEDHELVIAALTQLCLQKVPVTCEYRLRSLAGEPAALANQPAARFPAPPNFRFVRDTLTPHYDEDGLMDGWEGLVEDITEQRALSKNLRRMTTMLQVLISNLPTAVYFVQAPLGFPILVNARARQLLGQREDLSTGLAQLSRLFRLHRPDGTEYPWEELPVAKALRLGVACRANDIVLHRPDGRKVPLITWAAPIDLHGTGTPDAAVWVLEDWTAMHQTELALRESELRLRAIIDTMVEGVMVQDSSGAVIDVNAAACAILGVAREKLLDSSGLAAPGQCVDESGAALSRDQQPDKHALRTGQPVRGAIIGLKSDPAGDVRWLLVNSLPLAVSQTLTPNHQRARVVTTFADITQQVKAQDAQRLTRDRYQSLIETLPFMLIQRDQDCNITYMNPAALQLTGHTAEEFFRPGFCESIIHPEDVPLFKAALETVSQGQSTRIEARFYAKDQTLKTVLAFFNPNFADGRVVGSTSMVVDMSKQRKLEEELQQAKHLEFVGRLASGTVHDFNNLLQVLMGEAGLAKVAVSEQHPVWHHLVKIEDIGDQASHLAAQILTFSKQRPKQIRPVDVNALVEQTLRLAKSVMPDRIAVETHLDAALPMAQGDDGPLKQVLMNLCLNARDAMPNGGKLTIRTAVSAPPKSSADETDESWVHLAIQDTGIGMNETVRRRVFDAFFSTKEHGTGLGLAVVQQIIKELGGIIDVWSEPGVGTRFDVWLKQEGGQTTQII